MATEVGRWAFGDFAAASEFIADQVGGQAMAPTRFDLYRIAGGKGWRVFEDEQGLVALELSAEECDAHIIAKERCESEAAERERLEEERRRDEARHVREMAPASDKASR